MDIDFQLWNFHFLNDIEKHFILDRNSVGPDSSFSIEPDELQSLCAETYNAWKSLGLAGYETKQAEEANLKFRRSIYFTKDVREGDVVTKESIRRIRPGFGLEPKYYDELLGEKVNCDVSAGTPAKWSYFSKKSNWNFLILQLTFLLN